MGKVVYILSAGHSGSTLLDLSIGTLNGVFSSGEVVHLSWQILRGSDPRDRQSYCSCGDDFKSCSVWKKVVQNLEHKHKILIFKNPHGFILSMFHPIKYGKSLKASIIKRIAFLFYPTFLSKIILNLLYVFYKKSIVNNWNLFDEICKTTNTKYVIDSSKNMLRYMLLKKHRPDNIKLILLIRDIHGVSSSSHHSLSGKLIKKRVKNWANLYIKRSVPLLDSHKQNEFIIIKYEDLCSNPVDKIKSIAKFLDLKENINTLEIDTDKYHLVAGNPIRNSGKIRIRKDTRWQERLSEEQKKELSQVQCKLDKALSEFENNYI